MTAVSRQARAQSQPRRGLRRVEAATFIGISPTKFDQMVSDGRMPQPKKIDGATVWDLVRLETAFDALPDGDESPNPWG